MAGRYDNRYAFTNTSPLYGEQFKNRGIKQIVQFNTANFKGIEIDDIMSLSTRTHIWKLGDKFYKLAAKAYGDPRLWWIIPWFNKKPLESDFEPGEIVNFPFPLSEVLELFYQTND